MMIHSDSQTHLFSLLFYTHLQPFKAYRFDLFLDNIQLLKTRLSGKQERFRSSFIHSELI